jgi:hypothetical protein
MFSVSNEIRSNKVVIKKRFCVWPDFWILAKQLKNQSFSRFRYHLPLDVLESLIFV